MITNEEIHWIEQAIRPSGSSVLETHKLAENVLASVYQVVSSKGLLYFKTGIGREAEITAELYSTYPELLPTVINFEASRNWLLSADGGDRLSEINSIQLWHKSIVVLASFHRASKTINIPSGKVPSIFIENIFQSFEHCISDAEWIEYWEIDGNIRKCISGALIEMRTSVAAVESLGLGVCTCHGDAQPMNSLSGENGNLWFDWRESHTANPAIDIGWFLVWLMPFRKDLAISVSEVTLIEFMELYLKEVGVQRGAVGIYSVMQYALIYRIVYFHKQFYKKQYGKPYVEYLTRLLNRVLERRIG